MLFPLGSSSLPGKWFQEWGVLPLCWQLKPYLQLNLNWPPCSFYLLGSAIPLKQENKSHKTSWIPEESLLTPNSTLNGWSFPRRGHSPGPTICNCPHLKITSLGFHLLPTTCPQPLTPSFLGLRELQLERDHHGLFQCRLTNSPHPLTLLIGLSP